MTVDWQLTIDCASPERLVPFWATALGYVPADPPEGYASWRDYYLSLDVPESELDCEGGRVALPRPRDTLAGPPRTWTYSTVDSLAEAAVGVEPTNISFAD